MEYLKISPLFFEDNKQFFENIITTGQHGKWTRQHLHGDFICLLTTMPHIALFGEGALSVYDGQPHEQNIALWSSSRVFDPDIPLNGMEPDIEITANCEGSNMWYFDGDVRLEFLANEASAELEKELLNAASKFGDPALWAGKAQV